MYGDLPVISWELTPHIKYINEHIEKFVSGLKIKCCLAHVYINGNHYVSSHQDKEAMDPSRHVFSVSCGATRKFRIRGLKQTKGWIMEYELEDGMLVWMKEGCQERYKHEVPKQTKITKWRINLTFRY